MTCYSPPVTVIWVKVPVPQPLLIWDLWLEAMFPNRILNIRDRWTTFQDTISFSRTQQWRQQQRTNGYYDSGLKQIISIVKNNFYRFSSLTWTRRAKKSTPTVGSLTSANFPATFVRFKHWKLLLQKSALDSFVLLRKSKRQKWFESSIKRQERSTRQVVIGQCKKEPHRNSGVPV